MRSVTSLSRRMAGPEIAYLFERLPSFGQTFCYREVAELDRQGARLVIFSIRRPKDERHENWDRELVSRVTYLPDEQELVREVDRALRKGIVSDETRHGIEEWGRQPDFLRLYQAIYIGLRVEQAGCRRVHAHFAGLAARTAYWIKEFFGIPYSFTAHANDIFAPRKFAIGLDKVIGAADAIVAVSDYGANFLKQRYVESAAKVMRVYNGVDLAQFRVADFSETIPSIISIGRLIEKKGFADLIAACAILKRSGRDFSCKIIGEGPLDSALRAQILSLSVGDCVELTGPRSQSEIRETLADATVFVLPCTTEADGGMDNLPTVIMEAMAAGLPVISTPVAGVPEMVEEERTGLLVPEKDPPALAAAIDRVVSDRDLARRLGSNGLAVAQEKFSIARSARSLRAIFAKETAHPI